MTLNVILPLAWKGNCIWGAQAVRTNHNSSCCKTFLPPHAQRRLQIPHKVVLKCVFLFIHRFPGCLHEGLQGCACFPAPQEPPDARVWEWGRRDPCVGSGRLGWSLGHAGPDWAAEGPPSQGSCWCDFPGLAVAPTNWFLEVTSSTAVGLGWLSLQQLHPRERL